MATLQIMQAWIGLLVQNELTTDQITTLLNMADLEECEDYQWARLKTDVAINSFAALTALPVTVTQGSATVTINSGQFPPVTGQFVLTVSGQAFAPLPVVPNSSASATLTLGAPYPGPSSATATATLFPLWYSATGLQQVLGVRQEIPLTQTTHEQINVLDAYRAELASPATMWAPGGRDSNDNAQIELWPIETTANAYIVYGLRGHQDMVAPTDLPAIPSDVVAAKACAKACEALVALRGDPRWMNMRDYYYKRYEEARDRARRTDAEQFGIVNTIQDKYASAGPGGNTFPGFDIIGSRDIWPWG